MTSIHRMPWLILWTAAVACIAAGQTHGQNRYGTGASGLRPGMTGARGGQVGTTGYGAAGGYGAGVGGYGAGGYGAGGFGGMGAFGAGAMRGSGGPGSFGVGGMGMGQSAFGGGQLNPAVGQMMGQRFQQGNFVGRDAVDVQTMFQGQNSQQMQGAMFGAMIENWNEMRESRRRWRDRENAPPPVRVQLRPAFDLPTVDGGQAATATQSRVAESMLAGGLEGAQVTIAGRVAILRGVVATERDRALAEQLARLEPGVSDVRNLLTLAPVEEAATASR